MSAIAVGRTVSIVRYLPGTILGAFLARLLGEAIGMPNNLAVAGLALLLMLVVGWLLARRPIADTWPAILLLAYVVYPELDLRNALWVTAVTAVTWWQVRTYAIGEDLSWGRPVLYIGLGVGAAFLLLYLSTLVGGVQVADSGEFQVVATNLGVAHPPGFPLYTMLAHLMTRLPLPVEAAVKVSLFSALTSAVTVVVVYWTVILLSRRQLAALTAAIALGTSTTFWAQATTTNIRSLTGLFASLMLLGAIQFAHQTRLVNRGQIGHPDRWLVLTALFTGLGITHHPSLLFLAVIVATYLVLVDRDLLRTPRRWIKPFLAGLVGLLPLLYLPLRANSGARGASPGLATMGGFLEHVLALGFRGDLFYFTDPQTLGDRLIVMGNVLTFQFGIILLLGVALGIGVALWRDRPLAVLLGGSMVVFVLVAATYRAPQTVEYMMPAYIAAVLLLGYGSGKITSVLVRWGRVGIAAGQVVVAGLLVAAMTQGLQHYESYATLHNEISVSDFTRKVLKEAPPDSIVLAHWHWATPLWYLQEVEGLRPDVTTRFVFPEGESYPETWNRRATEAFDSGRPTITTFYDPQVMTGLPRPIPIDEATLFVQQSVTELPDSFTTFDLQLGQSVDVVGYQLDVDELEPRETAVLTIAWRPIAETPEGMSLFVHLVDPSGAIVGQDDVIVAAGEKGLLFTQFHLVPRLATLPGVVTAQIGATVGGVSQPDDSGKPRASLVEIDITSLSVRPYTRNRVILPLHKDTSQRLIGYDWDRTIPGQLRLYLHWQLKNGYQTQIVDNPDLEQLDLPVFRGPWGIAQEQWVPGSGGDSAHYVPFAQGITWTGQSLGPETVAPGWSIKLPQYLSSDRPIRRDIVLSVRLIGLEDDGFHWAWWDLNDSIPALGAIPTLKWIQDSTVVSPSRTVVDEAAFPGQGLTGGLTLYDAFTNRPLAILDERITAETPWVPLGMSKVSE